MENKEANKEELNEEVKGSEENITNPEEQKVSNEDEAKEMEATLNFISELKAKIEGKLRTFLGLPIESGMLLNKKQLINITQPDYETQFNSIVKNFIQKHKGFCRVIYSMHYGINKTAPIVLYGYGSMNKECKTFAMHILYGHGDFPDDSIAELPLNNLSVMWYKKGWNEFLDVCVKIEQERINLKLQNEENKKEQDAMLLKRINEHRANNNLPALAKLDELSEAELKKYIMDIYEADRKAGGKLMNMDIVKPKDNA